MDPLCYFCFVFGILSCLFLTALWSPAGKALTSWLSFVTTVMLSCLNVTFPYGVLRQVWYLIVSIPDLCLLPYFVNIREYTSLSDLIYYFIFQHNHLYIEQWFVEK